MPYAAGMDSQKKILLSKREAAQLLSISMRSLEYLLAAKQLASRRVGRRVLVPYSALAAFANRDHFGPVTGKHV